MRKKGHKWGEGDCVKVKFLLLSSGAAFFILLK